MSLDVIELVTKHDPRRQGRTKFWRFCPHLLTNSLKEPAVVLADFTRFLKGPRSLFVETPKVALDVLDVELKVAADEIGIGLRVFRIAWHERPGRPQTGRGGGFARQARDQKYSLCHGRHAQPEGV